MLRSHVQDSLLQLAFSWTHDMEEAKDLVEKVLLDKPGKGWGDEHERKLKLYSRLFHYWCCRYMQRVDLPKSTAIGNIDRSGDVMFNNGLSQLPMFQRIVITLVDIAGLSYGDVGSIVNVQEKQVGNWITSARTSMLRWNAMASIG
jgi:hypothetical protein